jgi:hypothetical protein
LRKYLAIILILININTAISQSIRYSVAMPYIGLSAYSTKQQDVFSFTANQAALAGIKETSIGVYGERRFLLAATSNYALATAIPTKLGNFGVAASYSGFKNFNENKIGLAYARNLGKKVDVGVQFNYYGYRVPTYGNATAIFFEAGAIMHFTEKFNGGLHVYNPVGGKLNNGDNEKLAAAYKLGFGYDASDDFFVSADIVKEEDKPINVIAGFQYGFSKQFFARAGFMSESTTAFAGLGLSWKNLRLDVAGSYHPQLGFSPGLMLITNFASKKEN